MLELFQPHSLEQLKSLLESIGLIATETTAVVVGAVKAIKFLRGRPKSVEEIKPGEFRLTTDDDRSITVDRSTHTLINDSSITHNILKIYAGPLEGESSVTDVKIYLKGQESSAIRVERSEIPTLREFVNPSSSVAIGETVTEKIHNEVFLNPKRGAFGDDPKDWSFRRGDDVITATIKDKEFLAGIDNGDIRLNHSDLLIVDLLERQKVKGTIVQKLTYEILKVTRYERGLRQASLPLLDRPVDSE